MKASMRSSRTVTPMLSHDRSMARGKRKPPVAESGPGWWWTGRPRPGNWFLVGGAMADDAVKMAGSGEVGLGAREGQLFQLLAPLPLQQPRSGVNRSWAVKCSPLTGAAWRRAGCLPGDRWDAGREAGDMRQAPTLCSALHTLVGQKHDDPTRGPAFPLTTATISGAQCEKFRGTRVSLHFSLFRPAREPLYRCLTWPSGPNP